MARINSLIRSLDGRYFFTIVFIAAGLFYLSFGYFVTAEPVAAVANAAAPLTATTVSVHVDTNPQGLTFTADGMAYSSAQTFDWELGSLHTLSAASPQSGATDTRY